jgi:hypothetical protein
MDTKIFATRSDLIPRIERVESQKDLHYARTGLFYHDEIITSTFLKDVKEMGYNTTGQYISGIAVLVVEKKHKIKIRKVKQRTGGYLYAIDQLKNPHSIVFQPGGMYENSYLIRGGINTVSESKESKQLFHFFSKGITKGFTKIRGWYVGPEAMKLMNSGVRLITMHINESPEYDLAVPISR